MTHFVTIITLSILALAFWPTSVIASSDETHEDLASQLSRMESKVTQLESFIIALQKEVTRMKSIPPQIDRNSPATESDLAAVRQATTRIPRSCQDLRCMGQIISGMYAVMGNTSVEMVFCDFSKAPNDPSFQQWVGFASVKKNPTYFYVQRRSYFYTVGVPIPYEITKLNIGGAMDLPSGKFTAPAKGTYFFSWTGMAAFPPSNTTKIGLGIRLYLNGNLDANKIGSSYVSDTNTGYQISPLTLQSTINLVTGDQIWLQIYTADTGMSLYDSNWYYTHFTGWLLDQDLSA